MLEVLEDFGGELVGAAAGDDEDGGGVVGAEPGGDVKADGNSSIDLARLELTDDGLDTFEPSHAAVDEREQQPDRRISCLKLAERRPGQIRQQGELLR